MNKHEVPVYKELVLALKEQKKQLQDIVEDIDNSIAFYDAKIAAYIAQKRSHEWEAEGGLGI